MRDNDLLELIERMVEDARRDVGTQLSAAEALSLTDEIESLKAGMATRSEIGQAQGIIMERFQLDAHAAFATLVRLSQHTNRKLIDIARELAQTGDLPKDPTGARESRDDEDVSVVE